MLRKFRILPILVASALLGGTPSHSNRFAYAQSVSPSDNRQTDAQTRIRVSSDLVVLSVTVKDKFGNLVPDLQKREFRIFDDNVEQSIDVFTADAFPVSLIVLVDDDLKSNDATEMVRGLHAIAAGISASDEARVCRFDLKFYPGDAFTADLDGLLAQLTSAQDASGPSTAGPVPFVTGPSWHAPGVGEPSPAAPTNLGSAPTKALDDAIFSAAQLLHDRGRTRRKAILLISDGINGERFNHHTYQETLQTLIRDNISVYSLAVGSTSARRKFSRLINYANESGGETFYVAKTSAMEKLYSRITEQARHEYTLAYVPRGNDRNSTYHVIRVTTTRESLHVKTRLGYYTPSAPNIP
ncbi:MAG TPA: VWA domain-containing protein [Candidatus Dormibacteraeota bacterium]|nr:VWA domain-containing protein [Candidatus Dormibacteraeota bacterium]